MNKTTYKPPRNAPAKPDFVPYQIPVLHKAFPDSIPDKTESGELNLFGVIKQLTLEIQNRRRWERSTCKRASKVAEDYLYTKFSNRPFVSLTEEDLYNLLDEIQKPRIPYSTQERLKFLVRMIFAVAFELKFTDTTLWGIPEWTEGPDDPFEGGEDYAVRKEKVLKDMYKKKLDHILGAGRSVSVETELDLFLELLASAQTQGEMIAGLIIWICGTRPGEACSLRFKHLCQLAPGVWGFVRADGDTEMVQGKTKNASRFLDIPDFFYKFLHSRINYLKSLDYTSDEIADMYIVCPGQNYASDIPVSVTGMNRHLKAAYCRANVAEDMMAHAYYAIKDDPVVREHCEGSSTAYLGRHQVCTENHAAGVHLNTCALMAGHAKLEGKREKTDLARPDIAQQIHDKMNTRPIVKILNAAFDVAEKADYQIFEYGAVNRSKLEMVLYNLELPTQQNISFEAMSSEFVSGIPLEVEFEKEKSFSISIVPNEPNQRATILTEGISNCVMYHSRFLSERSKSENIHMENELLAVAQKALEKFRRRYAEREKKKGIFPNSVPHVAPEECTDVSDIAFYDEWTKNGETDIYEEGGAEDICNSKVHAVEKMGTDPTQENTDACDGADIEQYSECVGVEFQEESSCDAMGNSDLRIADKLDVCDEFSDKNQCSLGELHLKSSKGLIRVDISSLVVGELGRNGAKCEGVKSNTVVYGFLYHDMFLPKYYVSPEGMLFQMSGDEWEKLCMCGRERKNKDFLKENVFVPPLCNGEDMLFCLSKEGWVRAISVQVLDKCRKALQLVALEGEQEIVDISSVGEKDGDVLILSDCGEILRVKCDEINVVKSSGTKLVRGLDGGKRGSHAVKCIPYNNENLLIISADGIVYRMSYEQHLKTVLLRKSLSRKGVALVKGDAGIVTMLPEPETPSALLLCTSAGYIHCLDCRDIPFCEVGGRGVQAITFRSGSDAQVVGAKTIPLSMIRAVGSSSGS